MPNQAALESKSVKEQSSLKPVQMPEQVQKKMEGAFGYNLSKVKMTENSYAETIGARAYAQGNEINFAPGEFNPLSSKGQELIGHEIGHIVQQKHGEVSGQGKIGDDSINTSSSLEAAADRAGKIAAHSSERAVAGEMQTLEVSGAGVMQGRWAPATKPTAATALPAATVAPTAAAAPAAAATPAVAAAPTAAVAPAAAATPAATAATPTAAAATAAAAPTGAATPTAAVAPAAAAIPAAATAAATSTAAAAPTGAATPTPAAEPKKKMTAKKALEYAGVAGAGVSLLSAIMGDDAPEGLEILGAGLGFAGAIGGVMSDPEEAKKPEANAAPAVTSTTPAPAPATPAPAAPAPAAPRRPLPPTPVKAGTAPKKPLPPTPVKVGASAQPAGKPQARPYRSTG